MKMRMNSTTLPANSRKMVKLDGSIAPSCSAKRAITELAAKAMSAKIVVVMVFNIGIAYSISGACPNEICVKHGDG